MSEDPTKGAPLAEVDNTLIVERPSNPRLGIIQAWPSAWGDRMMFLLSDGQGSGVGWHPGKRESIKFPDFGIELTEQTTDDGIIGPAVICFADVTSKSVEGVADASRRINELLGLLVLSELGHCTLRWFSFATHVGGESGSPASIAAENYEGLIAGYLSLPASTRRQLRRALYWLRMAKGSQIEGYRMALARSFESYWNAVDCISATVRTLAPIEIPKETRLKNVRVIYEEVLSRGSITLADAERMGKAARGIGDRDILVHAIATVYGSSESEILEIRSLVRDLYELRNRVKHAKIDVEEDDELQRFEALLSPIKYLALDLLFVLLGRKGFGGWSWIKLMLDNSKRRVERERGEQVT